MNVGFKFSDNPNRKLLNGKLRKRFTTHEKPKAVCAYEKPSGAPDLD